MPTEPSVPTLSQVVRRAVEVCDPEGAGGELERYLLVFEDRDEPITAIDDLAAEAFGAAREGAVEPIDPAVTMAAAVTTYLGFRRDELQEADEDILRLAARSEFDGNPPPDVAEWLSERGVDV
jgi:hypothetical protein